MNKWQIICPLAAMALFAAPFLFSAAQSHRKEGLLAAAYYAGHEIITKTNATLFTTGPDLQQRLNGFLASPSKVAVARLGDEPPPIGDGKATMRLFLKNETGERLGIRIQHDPKDDQFRVLSFWTLDPAAALP